MKKILVTGACGYLGIKVLDSLLDADSYEITALDLRNKINQKRIKPYLSSLNMVYGDILDSTLMEALIKGHDYIIHLAGIMPPFAEIKAGLGKVIDYEGTKSVIDVINKVNPNCFLIYPGTTSVYGKKGKEITAKEKPTVSPEENYSFVKLRCEEVIKENLKNFVILRLPYVLGNPSDTKFVYNFSKNSKLELITLSDAASAIVKAIEFKSRLNKRTLNITGGTRVRLEYKTLVKEILKTYGISMNYILTRMFVDKNYCCPYIADGELANDILNFRSESFEDYVKSLKRNIKAKRKLNIVIGKLFLK